VVIKIKIVTTSKEEEVQYKENESKRRGTRSQSRIKVQQQQQQHEPEWSRGKGLRGREERIELSQATISIDSVIVVRSFLFSISLVLYPLIQNLPFPLSSLCGFAFVSLSLHHL